MKIKILAAVSLIVILCGQTARTDVSSETAERETSAPQSEKQEKPPINVMEMKGVNLYMHDFESADGKPRNPTFWVHAEAGQLAEGQKVWSLQKTKAVIYREDGDDFHIEALEGQFHQERQEAVLRGAVRLTTGSLMISLEDVVWNNEENTATSDRPVHLRDGGTRLDAQSLVIDAKSSTLTLGKGSGYVRFVESTL